LLKWYSMRRAQGTQVAFGHVDQLLGLDGLPAISAFFDASLGQALFVIFQLRKLFTGFA